MRSYFSGRRVELRAESSSIEKHTTRGCPQGSILGPDEWNMLIGPLLDLELPAGCHLLAYADDVTALLGGRTKLDVQTKGQAVIDMIRDWTERHSLRVAPEKCAYVTLKGEFARYAGPSLKLGTVKVKQKQKAVLLGLKISSNGSFPGHVEDRVSAAISSFALIRRAFHRNWGARPDALSIIYRCAIVPKVTYGVAIWGDQIDKHRKIIAQRLRTCQRFANIAICAGAASVSHAASQVLAGEPPLDMVASELKCLDRFRNGSLQESHLGETVDFTDMKSAKAKLREITLVKWQNEWDRADTGRTTYSFLPNIRQRLEHKIRFNVKLTRVLTGHSSLYGDYRHRILKMPGEIGLCAECAVTDTVLHRIPMNRGIKSVRNSWDTLYMYKRM
ncbi:hypothetical protein WDU94_003713 [Cyamophila willieti]